MSESRLQALANKCRNRGGSCPCTTRCQALIAVEESLFEVRLAEKEAREKRNRLEATRRRLLAKPATLKPDFVFDINLQPVIVFDGDEAHFGYEDDNGEWIDQDVWPFNEDVVWPDDCERLGFKVE